MHRVSLLAVTIVALTACSETAPCVEGSSQACACSGGRSGVQVCSAAGRYEACDCEGSGRDGGAIDGATGDSGVVIGTGETVSREIGPEGGSIELTNATITVPAGTLSTTTTITVTETTMPTPAGYRAFSPLYRFEPAGLTFASPATVSIRSRAAGADVPLGTLFWSRSASEGGGWERRGGIPDGGMVAGEVDHFSYGFIADGVDYTETPDTSCVRTRVLDTRTLPPSGVGLFFAMDDCWGRPITDLTTADVRVFEDDAALSSEASAEIFAQRGLQVFVTLAIDVSASTRPIQADVVAAARRFVETLNEPSRGLRDRVQVAILGFAGEAGAAFQQPHTLDLDLVLTRLDELATYTPTDASSTNLNGALVSALDTSRSAQQAFRDRNRGGAFSAGYVVLFTDGTDTAGRVTAEDASASLHTSLDDVVGVGLRGDDYDPAALRHLLAAPDDPTGERAPVIDADGALVLDRDFAYLAARIAGQVRRSYLLGYCSPKRSGTHTVYAGHRDATEAPRVWGTAPEFDAAGFTGGCATSMFDPATTCAGAECGGFGCGACDDRVAACDATASPANGSTCISHCVARNLCSGETITNPRGYDQTCASTTEATLCDGGCTSLLVDEVHCGSCGVVCPSGIDCIGGSCACPAGASTVCGSACVDTATNTANCGTCGTTCPGRMECVAGSCVCPSDAPTTCGGACVDTTDSPAHCGGCGMACSAPTTACSGGRCLCPGSGLEVCGADCVDRTSDFRNCGSCGNRCFCTTGTCLQIAQLVVGGENTCVLLMDGTVRCWGGNIILGTARAQAFEVTGLSGVSQLTLGGRHACARLTDQTVRCWGANNKGQLGDGSTTFRSAPVAVVGLVDVVEVTAGAEHTCARLTDGTARCWGENGAGQVGNGSMTRTTVPVVVMGLSDATGLSAGGAHTCARFADGTVHCWGQNDRGQLGDGSSTNRSTPVPVLGLSNVAGVAAGSLYTCAALSDGTARCWGNNDFGQLGDGTSTSRRTPVIVAGLSAVSELSPGRVHTCARGTDGSVQCWGGNAGALGDGTETNRTLPVAVVELRDAVEVSAGFYHTCARLTDGTLRCWGMNEHGELGTSIANGSTVPLRVMTLSGSASLAAGEYHTCAGLTDGTARCWGYNPFGQLGDGTTSNHSIPMPVVGLSNLVELITGYRHTCARRADASVVCWGSNADGQLGLGSVGGSLTTPAVVTGLSGVVGLAAGYAHTCAALTDGTARCWGLNSSGQLGDGTMIGRTTPVTVAGLAGVSVLSANRNRTCALVTDGTVRCWGDGSPTPSMVAGLSGAAEVRVGFGHACARFTDGTVRCWGNNVAGALGDGGAVSSTTTPVPVIGLSTATQLVVGDAHSCVRLTDGTVRCWGGNTYGQIGDGTTNARTVPVAVRGIATAEYITAGRYHTCARLTDGTARCWGWNSGGQLGAELHCVP